MTLRLMSFFWGGGESEGNFTFRPSSQQVSEEGDVFKLVFSLTNSPGRGELSQKLTGMRSIHELDVALSMEQSLSYLCPSCLYLRPKKSRISNVPVKHILLD
jgi:hypothetical protein